MALGRHLSRIVIVKTLYPMLFAQKFEYADLLQISLESANPTEKDVEFIENTIKDIITKISELKAKLQQYATERPIDTVSLIDQSVLYLGAYELMYGDRKEVPELVAINEAVEIAKDFSGDTNTGFVNGVLNAIYQEIKPTETKKTEPKEK